MLEPAQLRPYCRTCSEKMDCVVRYCEGLLLARSWSRRFFQTAVLVAFFYVSLSSAVATEQIGELLDFEGAQYRMYSAPLEDYLKKLPERPSIFKQGISTANWKGYFGHWKVENGNLYLVKVTIDYHDRSVKVGELESVDGEVPLKSLFPGRPISGPVLADWFTGELVVPTGKELRQLGFGTLYEKELFFKVEKGRVIMKTDLNYAENPFLSPADLRRRAIENHSDSSINWKDARLFPQIASVDLPQIVTTRGMYRRPRGASGWLWIPDTAKTQMMEIKLLSVPTDFTGADGRVEVSGSLTRSDNLLTIAVTSIRELKPGETIHHPDYPKQHK